MSDRTGNLLLDSLSPPARRSVMAHTEEMELAIRSSLQSQELTPRHAYFMTRGIASVVVEHMEGASSETLLIGREGMTGALALLGGSAPTGECFIQVPGVALQIPLERMREIFESSSEVRGRVLQCVQQQAMTTMQIAACNAAHEAEPRLARWLLMVADRTGETTFPLTQEFLAEMLGARRTTVALAAGVLQRSGLIEYTRGRITILSREALEGAACECYTVTRRLLQEMYR